MTIIVNDYELSDKQISDGRNVFNKPVFARSDVVHALIVSGVPAFADIAYQAAGLIITDAVTKHEIESAGPGIWKSVKP